MSRASRARSVLRCAVACCAVSLVATPGAFGDDENLWRSAGRAAVERARALLPDAPPKAKNVIVFVGDGMGMSTITAARIFDGQQRGKLGEENELAFERFPYVALSKTYSVNAQVSESAATMTAMMTGVKTNADVVGLDERSVPSDYTSVERSRARTLLEDAEARGLSTGVVTTTRVTHATPAACYAHAPHRDWENDSQLPPDAREAGFPDIARQLVEFEIGDGIDVVFGGGRAQFLPKRTHDPEYPGETGARSDDRDLLAAWQGRHPEGSWVWNRSQFDALGPATKGPVLGLFEPSHMRFEFERGEDVGGEPSLSEMTAKAIELLARNPRGYVLIVEGGRIDHGHHFGNAFRALGETVELSNAVRAAESLVKPRETLIVVTADHSHVFTMAGYPTRGNDILGLARGNDDHGAPELTPLKDMLGLPFTTLSYANGPGYTGRSSEQPEGAKRYPHNPAGYAGIRKGRPKLTDAEVRQPNYLQETTVPARNDTHAGEDVPIYATGPGASLFHGVQEQSFVFHAVESALGWNEKRQAR